VPTITRKTCIYATLGTSYFVRMTIWYPHSHPKHVEKRNKHTKKNCAPSWLYLQDYTGMHGQQNIIFDLKYFSYSFLRENILSFSDYGYHISGGLLIFSSNQFPGVSIIFLVHHSLLIRICPNISRNLTVCGSSTS
jgi:hypothetical protein